MHAFANNIYYFFFYIKKLSYYLLSVLSQYVIHTDITNETNLFILLIDPLETEEETRY
jgi:hypothetical protein